jgi:hypothetical protein
LKKIVILKKKKKKKKKRKKGKVSKKKKEECTGDYCCNPQCFVCRGTVIPPHHLDSVIMLKEKIVKK